MSHHAHDLFDLVATRADGWSLPELDAATAERFGPDARFHTCSQSGLVLGELLAFAIPRGKLSLADERIHAGAHTCGH